MDLTTPFFPSINSLKYKNHINDISKRIHKLSHDTIKLGRLSRKKLAKFGKTLLKFEALDRDVMDLWMYLSIREALCMGEEDVAIAMGQQGELKAQLQTATQPLIQTLGTITEELFCELIALPKLSTASFHLQRLREQSQFALSAEAEMVIDNLQFGAFTEWENLYHQVIGQSTFDIHWPDGRIENHPLSSRMGLLTSSDNQQREVVREGSRKALAELAPVAARSLNAITGYRATVAELRNTDILDEALRQSGIDHDVLKTMIDAVHENREISHDYLNIKKQLLGLEQLTYEDLVASVPLGDFQSIDLDSACKKVEVAFQSIYPPLVKTMTNSIKNNAVDLEARDNKSGNPSTLPCLTHGGSCVYMNFQGGFNDINTLAHEFGHAYHYEQLTPLRYWRQTFVTSLMEFPSNVAESIYRDALLKQPNLSPEQEVGILCARLDIAVKYTLGTPFIFEFDEAVHRARMDGPLSVSEINQLCTDKQRKWYGDTLGKQGVFPYFWVPQPHFYFTEIAFYTFPYMIGYLLGNIMVKALHDNKSAAKEFQQLLRESSSMPTQKLVKNVLGIDLKNKEVWQESLAQIKSDLDRLKCLLPKLSL